MWFFFYFIFFTVLLAFMFMYHIHAVSVQARKVRQLCDLELLTVVSCLVGVSPMYVFFKLGTLKVF